MPGTIPLRRGEQALQLSPLGGEILSPRIEHLGYRTPPGPPGEYVLLLGRGVAVLQLEDAQHFDRLDVRCCAGVLARGHEYLAARGEVDRFRTRVGGDVVFDAGPAGTDGHQLRRVRHGHGLAVPCRVGEGLGVHVERRRIDRRCSGLVKNEV